MRVNLFSSLLLMCLSTVAMADDVPTPKEATYCTVCHGNQLKGNVNIKAPRLTGLSQWYIERQLQKFKQGIRGSHSDDIAGGEMMMMVANLSDEQLKNIAKWVTQTHSVKPAATIEADVQQGKKLYQSCSACHGDNAQGNKAIGAPRLSGLNDWYIYSQLNHYRLGTRGTGKTDMYGLQMKAASAVITNEQDAANLAAYIHNLN